MPLVRVTRDIYAHQTVYKSKLIKNFCVYDITAGRVFPARYYAGSALTLPITLPVFPLCHPLHPSKRFAAESNRADRSLHLSLGRTIKCRKLRRKCYNEYIVTRISGLSRENAVVRRDSILS